MTHGTDQAVLGLGDGSVIGTGGNVADADNRLSTLEVASQTAARTTLLDAAGYTATTEVESAIAELYTYKPRFSTLTADSTDTQLNTPLIASGLSVTFPVTGTYEVEALLLYTTAAAADIQVKFSTTGTIAATVGTNDLAFINAPGGDATAARVPTLFGTSWTTAASLLTTGAPAGASPAFIKGKLVVTAVGALTIEFAQVTSDATNTHIDSGSYLKIQRVA